MQSKAKNVTAYLDEAPIERKTALSKFRELCRTHLNDFNESMEYGCPCYSRNGKIEAGFANQKNFIGLYILRTDVMMTFRELLKVKGVSLGKGVIRYSSPDKIDFELVTKLLQATQNSEGPICD
jgi:uncharacterized protein YdhG (YjbR/CyaY superfamily)